MLRLAARLGRFQAERLQKSIHTTTYLRNAESNPTVNLLNSTNALGRHRSKLKRNKALATLPESFLSTNYLKHASLGPLPTKYAPFVTESVWKELEFGVRSGLTPKGIMASFNHTDHLALNITDSGACYLQDHIVRQLAAKVKADLLVLDPQDLVFLAQHSFSRDAATLLPMLSSIDPSSNALLALRQQNVTDTDDDNDMIGRGKPGGAVEVFKKDEEEQEGYEEEDTDDDVLENDKMKVNVNSKSVEIDLEDLIDDTVSDDKDSKIHKISKSVLIQVSTKYTNMFKKFLSEKTSEEGKIIYLRDYSGMQDTFNRIMLKSLTVAVEDLKQKGHRLMMIASHAQTYVLEEDHLPIIPSMRSFSITPALGSEQDVLQWKSLMKEDEASRTTEINAKQFVAMYSQKNVLNLKGEKQGDLLKELLSMDISTSIWSPSEVDRRVTAAIGHALTQKKDNLDVQDVKAAHELVKTASALGNNVYVKRLKNSNNLRTNTDGSVDLDSLKRTCNEYERKLLARVVDPAKVQGSFADVRAPPETVDTLQSLISLPLIRPDLFQKGVLKKNFIPGVLLFGPPGTGKTMLAKAVAKDSGSRMLDIQASDVYDMYVGQGEKNVKAIFSLARQLSPCVVFIDEVDSLMNKRGSDYSSKSHREIINQFMVEWDGLSSNNQGVIVMAATNRPFDLDDAVLRRMPRRILVDLPNEKDREEIIKILLQDQEHSISYEQVAKATQHYSGSDLKNVCVTAALKAVQQEILTKKPQVLTMEHFKEAIKMIPPSSSEDMDTVMEIRKWDSKFGDGKKKKKPSLGF